MKKATESNDSPDTSKVEDAVVTDEPSNEQLLEADTVKNSSKGTNSGRLSHSVYTNSDHITLSPDHKVGEPCPEDCGGKLTTLPPGIVVKITGQGFAKVTKIDTKSRKGTFTTDILSYVDDHKIYLFYSSKKHAGENMQALLSKRPCDLPPVKYMCDALSRNIPKELKTILINCLTHGRRKFVEIEDFFPPECKYVINLLATVYHNDSIVKDNELSKQERLEYHQAING